MQPCYDDELVGRALFSWSESDDIIPELRRFSSMATLKSGLEQSRAAQRHRIGSGLLIAFLMLLSSAGNFWTIFPVARARGSQGSQGNDMSYDSEFQKGL